MSILRRKRTAQHVDGDRAIHAIESVVLDRGFALDRTRVDYGTDFSLHIFEDDGEYIGYLVGQSRGRRNLQANADGSHSLVVEAGHLRQWLAQPDPFVVVLYDLDRARGYWYCVQAHREKLASAIKARTSHRGYVTLRFDPAKVLDVRSLDVFRRMIESIQGQIPQLEYSEDV